MQASSEEFQPLSYSSSCDIVANPEPPLGNTVWSTLPRHTLPTCPLDQVVTELIQTRRPYEFFGGNVQEFQKHSFPSVQSLLNPEAELDAEERPVTNSIVTKIVQVMTVPTLPEQIAILYFMGSVIRWLISPTEANYNSMPEWLRPTPTQIARPHPVWVDLFVWPKARDRFCSSQKYHSQIGILSEISNTSLSINWPYQPSDMLMHINGPGSEIVLTPGFYQHIKDLNNWSVGPRMFEV
jgi:hypothetical protein